MGRHPDTFVCRCAYHRGTLGVHEFILVLDNSVTLSIESDYWIRDASTHKFTNPVEGAALLASLLDKVVLGYETVGDGTLILTFSWGPQVGLVDSSDRYESYVIRYMDKTIVV